MKVIIVRHGQTDDNIKDVIAGQGVNTPLNAKGIEQAKKLAEYLRNEKIDVAYVSDQIRALQTAEEILVFHPVVALIKSKELRERNYGEFEGKDKDAAKRAAESSGLAYHLFRPNGGESHADVHDRVGNFFKSLIEKHGNETVLLVSHGRAISLLLLNILEKELHAKNQEAHRPHNTGVAVLEIISGEPAKVHVLNSIKHLEL